MNTALPRRSPSHKPGFALLVALVLMAFLVLLMLGLSSLTTTNLQVSQAHHLQQLAQKNAWLGLTIALGELQAVAGPDQRTTARADITSKGDIANPHWTGVWQSIAPITAPHLDPVPPSGAATVGEAGSSLTPSRAELVAWLVSGNEQSPSSEFNHTPDEDLYSKADFGQNTALEAVYLVGASTLIEKGADPSASVDLPGAVVAPKVTIVNEHGATGGHYAWWVGDEGVKARVQSQQTPKAIGKSVEENTRLAFHLPVASDPAAINELKDSFDRTTPGLDQLLDYSSLHLAMEDTPAPALNRHWHDLSLYSRGLLTDTRWGGFRGDLTLAFENSNIFEKYFGKWNTDSDNFYFIKLSEFSAYDAKFPNWSNLRAFYKLKDRGGVANGKTAMLMAAPLDSTKAVYARESGAPYRNNPSSRTDGYHSNSPVHPLISRLQITIGIRYVETGVEVGGEPTYDPVILIKPLTGFYNPYNVTLDFPPHQTSGVSTTLRWSFLPLLTIRVFDSNGVEKAGGPVKFYTREILGSRNATPPRDLILQHPDFDLRPGENRLFGIWDDVSRTDYDSTGRLMIASGDPETYNPDAGFLVLPLQEAHTATADGETDSAPGKNNFGLSENEKAYLRVKHSDLFQLEIDSSQPGAVWIHDEARTDGIATSDRHILFFSPVADKATISENIPTADTGLIYVSEATVADSSQASGLENLITWGFWLRGSNDTFARSRLLVDHNIRTMGNPQNWDVLNDNFYTSSIFTGEFEGQQLYGYIQDPLANIINMTDARFTGFSGGSASSSFGGVDRVVLFDVPRSPLISLGALQHANIGRYTIDPTYIIGNSFPPARLKDLDKIYSSGYLRSDIDIWDLSYLINQQLWDSYYFSTIPTTITQSNINNLIEGSEQLPNHRFSLIYKGAIPTPEQLTNNSTSTASHTFYDVASNLMIEGAFNINSTSEEAWAAVLASSRDLNIPHYNLQTGAYSNASGESDAVFSRLPHPVDGKFTTTTDPTFWRGYRALTDTQISRLAKEIVTLIKARQKPFASLAEFVNRPLQAAPESGKAQTGLLQQAIENAGINNDVPGDKLKNIPNPPSVTHNQMNDVEAAVAFPGYLTQADILQTLAPILSARSDTFLIRSYGDAVNPATQTVEAQAWCEAIVQRIPHEVLDGADPASRSANRKFRILAFRWLSRDEI